MPAGLTLATAIIASLAEDMKMPLTGLDCTSRVTPPAHVQLLALIFDMPAAMTNPLAGALIVSAPPLVLVVAVAAAVCDELA